MLAAPTYSGRILVAAQAPSDANWRNAVVLDPVANVLRDHAGEEGPVPSMDEFSPDPRWINVSAANNPDSAIGGYAQTVSIRVYVARVDANTLLCKQKLTRVIAKVTRTHGNWKALMTYTAP